VFHINGRLEVKSLKFEKRIISKMKFPAALVIAAVNANDPVKCWEGEGANVQQFTENAVRVECGKRELCAMTVR
jgi:hypothetical protein